MRNKHATVVAYIALFIALGGTSYAAVKITGKQIKDNTITSSDVKNRSLLAKDFKAGQLPAGAQGAQGPKGLQGAKGDTGAPGRDGTDGVPGQPGTAKAFGFVSAGGVLDSTRSQGINSVTRPDIGTPSDPSDDNLFCFDLTFDPKVAVASAFANNAGIISAADIGQGASFSANCTAPNNDAMIRTWGSDGSQVPVGFSVIFE